MDNVDDYLNDLEILFGMDLLNNFEIVNDAVLVTMQDGSKCKVTVNVLA